MRTVSIFEAKTHLSRLIAEIENSGETIAITRHDHVVARLEPAAPKRRGNLGATLEQIRANAKLRAALNPKEAEPISWEEIKAEIEAEFDARYGLTE